MHLIKWAAALAISGLVPAAVMADEPRPHPTTQPSFEIRLDGNPFGTLNGRLVVVQGDGDPNAPAPHPGEPVNREQTQLQLREARRGLTFTIDMVKREKGAYLGVSASPPPTVLRKQLGLAPGMGLVVDLVVPDSPASKAGLQQYDVLQKLDDQLLINLQQLAVLVRSHKAGDEVKLGIIHEGKPVTLSLKLVEHELEPLADNEPGDEGPGRVFQAIPEPMVRPFPPGGKVFALTDTPLINVVGSMTYLEDGHSYSIVIDAEGHKTFSERDKDGKVMFENPIDTPEQREKLSAEQKEKLQKMEKHMPGTTGNPFWKPSEKPATTQPGKGDAGSEKK